MISIFQENGDIHKRTAATATGKPEEEVTDLERKHVKPVNFGICYLATEYALNSTFKKEYGIRKSLPECARLIAAVKKTYPRISEFQTNIAITAENQGGWVQTIYGYIRLLPGLGTGDDSADKRRAANTPIQGSAADIMKRSQNIIYDEIGKGELLKHGHVDMIAQIHDEIIFEIDEDSDLLERVGYFIKKIMERPPVPDFPVPVVAEASIGDKWGSKVSMEKYLKERGRSE